MIKKVSLDVIGENGCTINAQYECIPINDNNVSDFFTEPNTPYLIVAILILGGTGYYLRKKKWLKN